MDTQCSESSDEKGNGKYDKENRAQP